MTSSMMRRRIEMSEVKVTMQTEFYKKGVGLYMRDSGDKCTITVDGHRFNIIIKKEVAKTLRDVLNEAFRED